MADDPFDDIPFDLSDDDTEPCDCPTVVRATVTRGGRVIMTRWRPNLAEGGPSSAHLRDRERHGVAIADLRLVHNREGQREAIVEFMAAGRARERAEAALTAWARNARHRRIWFPGGPVELDDAPGLATAVVTCPSCKARWLDSTPNFWHEVRDLGHFPMSCPTCGNSLPQWDVVAGDVTSCRGA